LIAWNGAKQCADRTHGQVEENDRQEPDKAASEEVPAVDIEAGGNPYNDIKTDDEYHAQPQTEEK
jgi:hypothetical protein